MASRSDIAEDCGIAEMQKTVSFPDSAVAFQGKLRYISYYRLSQNQQMDGNELQENGKSSLPKEINLIQNK